MWVRRKQWVTLLDCMRRWTLCSVIIHQQKSLKRESERLEVVPTTGARGLSDSNGVILAVKELRLVPQRVLRCQKTFGYCWRTPILVLGSLNKVLEGSD